MDLIGKLVTHEVDFGTTLVVGAAVVSKIEEILRAELRWRLWTGSPWWETSEINAAICDTGLPATVGVDVTESR